MIHLTLNSGFKMGPVLTQLIRRGIESEILSNTGIANVEHNKGSKKDYQRIKDKEDVSPRNVVDTTKRQNNDLSMLEEDIIEST